jgi:predicted transcriptional regulator of viral defense system
VPVSLDTLGAERVLDDPWVLVPALYAPCYIGGRTAAEHWDLTEQIFKDIVVITAQLIREKHQVRHGTPFTLKHLSHDKFFGTKPVWRHQTKVPISDIHRTIVDMLDEPSLGGGIRNASTPISREPIVMILNLFNMPSIWAMVRSSSVSGSLRNGI